jgi:hypothetical protein
MRLLLACLVALVCFTAEAAPTVVVTAQDHATVIARRGVLVHSSCGQYEGIGCGSTPEAARRNCCFFGKRVIVEEGVAYSPARRQWFAVIRYR